VKQPGSLGDVAQKTAARRLLQSGVGLFLLGLTYSLRFRFPDAAEFLVGAESRVSGSQVEAKYLVRGKACI